MGGNFGSAVLRGFIFYPPLFPVFVSSREHGNAPGIIACPKGMGAIVAIFLETKIKNFFEVVKLLPKFFYFFSAYC